MNSIKDQLNYIILILTKQRTCNHSRVYLQQLDPKMLPPTMFLLCSTQPWNVFKKLYQKGFFVSMIVKSKLNWLTNQNTVNGISSFRN